MPSMGELIVILMIVTVVFGASRLPAIGESIGKAVRNLKRGLAEDDNIEVTPAERRVVSDTSEQEPSAEVAEADVIEKK
ncbi:MAG: twin-arginine translocase TatA/TatE family subunit [Myxococcota bacterium]